MNAPRKFRKLPVVIEAIQFTMNNADEIIAWAARHLYTINRTQFPTILSIETMEGDMEAHVGDWVIKGVVDEFYACAPSVFEQTYELFTG